MRWEELDARWGACARTGQRGLLAGGAGCRPGCWGPSRGHARWGASTVPPCWSCGGHPLSPLAPVTRAELPRAHGAACHPSALRGAACVAPPATPLPWPSGCRPPLPTTGPAPASPFGRGHPCAVRWLAPGWALRAVWVLLLQGVVRKGRLRALCPRPSLQLQQHTSWPAAGRRRSPGWRTSARMQQGPSSPRSALTPKPQVQCVRPRRRSRPPARPRGRAWRPCAQRGAHRLPDNTRLRAA